MPRTPTGRTRKWRSAARSFADVEGALARLGRRLKSLRKEKGITQERLGDLAQLDWRQIQNIEHARTNPTVATLLGICRGLGIRLADLFEGV